MNFKEYKALDYAAVADEIQAFWKEHGIFERSMSEREGQPTFTFYEGPPSANGTPGIHHVMARSIKDIFCRYQTLKGKQVKRKGGWDTHGLPIELQVEKQLGINKEDIGKTISVEDYNQECRKAVMKFTDQWNDLTERMGYWVDLENPYVTYHNEYIETLWYLLKELYKKGLLYKGYTIQPYSPAAGTGLSSHELNQPGTYRDVKDVSIVAQFRVKHTGKSAYLFDVLEEANAEHPAVANDVFILAWTTTPWTLPSNAALTVGKNITYVLVRTFNPYTHIPIDVVLAKDRVLAYFNENAKNGDFEAYRPGDKIVPWTVLMEFRGEHLEGIEYEQLMPYVQPSSPAFRVIMGDFVTTEDGTGVVHTAPTFGADDFRVAQQNGIPAILVKDETGKEVPLVNRRGRFVQEVTDFAGEYVKEQYLNEAEKQAEAERQGLHRGSAPKYLSVDERIGIKLKSENRAFNVQKFDHPYPHCWRTDKPLLYYPLDSWFIRTTAIKDKLVALNKTINWKPESTGTGRFGNWLENLVDWNLSRSRYWGTPLPIWRSEDGEEVCIGSVAELEQALRHALNGEVLLPAQRESNEKFLAGLDAGEFDLHRPYVDELYLVSASGKVMFRETDLIDVWFDSGAMPYAQWHYPFENQEIFDKAFPADYISEGVDQTRGWFFTLHAIGGLLFDSVAFKNVVSTGLVLDKEGEKMSKRKGNVINPFEALKQYGADPIRWYMVTNSNPWDNLRFNLEGVTEVRNKFFGTLTNTYNFFALYANLDGYQINEFDRVPREQLTELDRWILSKLNSLVRDVDGYYADYEPTKAGRAIQEFVGDHLSNWYVRLSRRRFWKGALTQDKRAAYETLQHCLLAVAQLMSPIAPFYADWLYKNLTDGNRETAKANGTPLRHDSVHLSDFHPIDTDWIDPELEASMELAQRVSSLVHSIRKVNKLKVRQPLARVLVPVLNASTKEQLARVEDLIKAEVNVKAVELLDDTSGVLNKRVKPNFKALGPKFGPTMKLVAAGIQAMTSAEISALESNAEFTIPHSEFRITPDDVEILTEDLPGYLTAQEGGLTVALDVTLTDELRAEGLAREFVNRIQNLRKDSGFEVTDKITIAVGTSDKPVQNALESNREYICTETQALSLILNGSPAEAVAVDVEEYQLAVSIAVA